MSAEVLADSEEHLSSMFSPIKAASPPPPKQTTRKRLMIGSLFGGPAPIAKSCITCGKTKCNCTHRASPSPSVASAQKEVWHLEVDQWEDKHTKPSSDQHFTSREKNELRRWYENLSSFSKGYIPSDELIIHLVTGNIINDERGLREVLSSPADQPPRNFSFFNFLRSIEKSGDPFYRRQLKLLVTLSRPMSKDSSVSLTLAHSQNRRKQLLDRMIDDTEIKQGQADSVLLKNDVNGKGGNSHNTDNFIGTVSKVITDEKTSFSLARQSRKLANQIKSFVSPVAKKGQRRRPSLHTTAVQDVLSKHLGDSDSDSDGDEVGIVNAFPPSQLSPCKTKLSSSPIAPPLWTKEDMDDTLAQTISRAVPSPLQNKIPPRRMIKKQRSFDQLVLTKQKSFNELHIQRQDSFGPKTSFTDKNASKDDDDNYGDVDEGECDIFDCLDRQIMEKTLKAGSLDILPPPLSEILSSPVKKISKRHSTDFTMTRMGSNHNLDESSIPHLPDLSAAPMRRLPGPTNIRRSQSNIYAENESRPFTPIDKSTKQLHDDLKMKSLVTPQEKRQALRDARKHGSSKILTSSSAVKAPQPQQQLVGSISTHSFHSLSKDFSDQDTPNDYGTLYDFVQSME